MPEETEPAARAPCRHPAQHEGLCPDCGHCDHDVILNGACLACGTTELDPIAMSPKKVDPALVPAERLRRRPPPEPTVRKPDSAAASEVALGPPAPGQGRPGEPPDEA